MIKRVVGGRKGRAALTDHHECGAIVEHLGCADINDFVDGFDDFVDGFDVVDLLEVVVVERLKRIRGLRLRADTERACTTRERGGRFAPITKQPQEEEAASRLDGKE